MARVKGCRGRGWTFDMADAFTPMTDRVHGTCVERCSSSTYDDGEGVLI